MPEYYPSIGDAVGAAMAHNIRLAHRDRPTGSEAPLQVRYIPPPTADPHSVPGMLVRLTQTASPQEVAAILEEVNSALTGPLLQVTELVAAAADWTRVRLDFGSPGPNPTCDVWQRLVTATHMLQQAGQELEDVVDRVPGCPVELSDPRHYEGIALMRSQELLHEVNGCHPAAGATSDPDATRRRAARATSPHASAQQSTPAIDSDVAPRAAKAPTRTSRTR